ncbi:hypothetical protein AGABI1DRAFT_133649 [Agaricus bisporus var. burnettii JB137-S8]|uniref:Uncharacterized protein n=1 Tax=Agaricus bisporus var. burnettii (strain JB137-S8 / ATCC MYA-4627 / FGSC 10392) TaxID=597362 RepID=K5VIF0_AGABU|nr:uncharacterized protein AGABI1DRAFT_133649 [Agaricus bisporus var. burnettii JB137-S8]EKM74089.1 hypothetical protein AGABI1DRAFT_133649 [Agaricus bisporus var. burnettii JB137-S8]
MQTARQEISKTMSDFLDREPTDPITLTQPSPDKAHQNEPDGSPWIFLISDLSEKEYELATRTSIVASKQAILFITKYHQQIPNFVMMLMGISFDEGRIDDTRRATVEAIQRTLSTEPSIATALTNLIKNPSRAAIEFGAFLAGITATHTPVPNSLMTYWCIKSYNCYDCGINPSILNLI